jgi:hypothetical protein
MKNEKIHEFYKSEQSSYYYYIGRLSLFESDMENAYENLTNCFKIAISYKGVNFEMIIKQILKYLVIA